MLLIEYPCSCGEKLLGYCVYSLAFITAPSLLYRFTVVFGCCNNQHHRALLRLKTESLRSLLADLCESSKVEAEGNINCCKEEEQLKRSSKVKAEAAAAKIFNKRNFVVGTLWK